MNQGVQDPNSNSFNPQNSVSHQSNHSFNSNSKQTPLIICIELFNNNHLHFKYEDTWTVETLIHKILSHKEYTKLYSNRTWHLNAKYHLQSLFDLHFALYNSIKDEVETKIDYKITLGSLRNLGLLKYHKNPFFIFKDNRNNGNLISTYEDKYELFKKMCQKEINYYSIYENYLPRVSTLFLLTAHPEIETYFTESKKCLNNISPFNLNPLITHYINNTNQTNNNNWFTYDDETVRFLALYSMKKFNIIANIKYDSNGKVYLEDKFTEIKLKDKDIEHFFLKCTIVTQNFGLGQETITKKLKITTKTTGYDVLETMSKKLEHMSDNFAFEPRNKILKVRSLNDYILDLSLPMVIFTYINQCVITNSEAEYIIIDNPFTENNIAMVPQSMILNLRGNETQNELFAEDKNDLNGSLIDNENYKKILSIASYVAGNNNNILDDANDNNANENANDNENDNDIQLNNDEDNNDILDSFMKEINNEIQTQTKETVEECSKLINDQNLSVMFDDSSWDISILSQSLDTSNISSFHPIPQRKVTSKKINPNQSNQDRRTLTVMSTSSSSSRPSILQDTSFTSKKKRSRINIPNTFIIQNQTTPDITSMLKDKNEQVNIKRIDRPFSITLRDVILMKHYDSYPYSLSERKPLEIILYIQLYCGNQPLSKIKKVTYESDNVDFHPSFNKRIYFDLNYNNLPPFVSLNITVKFNIYNKNKFFEREKIIGWVNFKLFDYKKRLMTGVHKLALLETHFSDDSFYCYMDNLNDLRANSVYIEVDSFATPIHYEKVQLEENFVFNSSALIISPTDEKKIEEILQRSPFDEPNNYDKEILWNNRYKLIQEPAMLAKVLKCADYTNEQHLIELEKILSAATLLSPIQSIELLTGQFLYESVRAFAVKCLEQASPQECESFLIQLVQGLKYETCHDSELSRYLLKMAISYPLTIGHSLFWNLRSEIYDPLVQLRFSLILEVFLNKIGSHLRELFSDEAILVTHLINLTRVSLNQYTSMENKITSFQAYLNDINNIIDKTGRKEISLPLNFKYRAKCIRKEKCKMLSSFNKPLLIAFENTDITGEDFIIEFKMGIDLRKEIYVLQLFKMMQTLWFHNNIKTKMTVYNVISTGFNQGMVEVVQNSKLLTDITSEETKSISKSRIEKWLNHNGIVSEDELVNNFLMSCLAYCIATFILGITDRNTRNVSLKTNGEVCHAGFERLLGFDNPDDISKRYKKYAPFYFPQRFMNYLDRKNVKKYQEFKIRLWEGFDAMRKNVDIVIALLRILLSTGLPELTEKSIKILESTMCLNLNEEDAKEFLYKMLKKSLSF